MRHWLCQVNRRFRGGINRNRAESTNSGRFPAWGISLAIHALVLAALALMTFGRPQAVAFITVLADWTEPELGANLEAPLARPEVLAPAANDATGSEPGGRAGEAGPIAAGIETASEQATRRVERSVTTSAIILPLDLDPRIPARIDLAVNTLGLKRGKGFATGGGFGSGLGGGTGDGIGSQFFELTSAGSKFVFVLDGSGSMTEPHKEARTKLERVKIELFSSILSMSPEQEFYVVFFNRFSVPMKASTLQPATPENKRRHLEWVAKLQGGGGTDPREALK
ncbi:MAG: hypothetical protein HY290_16965, partial [Planctomycetia bacterium]|nr:hypothetical protein [Planctomycetia bacterium]